MLPGRMRTSLDSRIGGLMKFLELEAFDGSNGNRADKLNQPDYEVKELNQRISANNQFPSRKNDARIIPRLREAGMGSTAS